MARERKTRSRVVKPGRMPVSEFAFDRAGAGSPFGDDIEFPVPAERLTYEHPDGGQPPAITDGPVIAPTDGAAAPQDSRDHEP